MSNLIEGGIVPHEVKWTEDEFKENYSKEWEQSVDITYYEHDIEGDFYIIRFNNKN